MIDAYPSPGAAQVDGRKFSAMATFCSDQRCHFDPAAWLRRSASEGKVVAVVAQYLAMTSWYGHEMELQLIAEELYPGISNLSAFSGETEAMGMNLAQFSVSTRFGQNAGH